MEAPLIVALPFRLSMQPVRPKHLAAAEEEDPILQVLEALVEEEELLL